jgi:protein-tyrosine phosphatase
LLEILTVCTGNICRSPLAEQLLRLRLAPLPVVVRSAGTYDLEGEPMTPESARLAAGLGVPAEDSASHRSHHLTERDLVSPDLVLTMTRAHRRAVVELAPARVRTAFTVREFARLASAVPEGELRAAAEAAGPDARERVRAAAHTVAAYRGIAQPLDDLADDDVIDPFRQSWQTYELSAAQLDPAIDEVVRVVRLAVDD